MGSQKPYLCTYPVSNKKMKNQFILSLILIFACGCHVLRPGTTADNPAESVQTTTSLDRSTQPRFLEGITTADETTKTPENPVKPRASSNHSSSKGSSEIGSREKFNSLQFKYAILTNSPVELLTNQKLMDFMDQWYGVPYHYGGKDKDGIDCSAFASLLMANVYEVNGLPRISKDQYLISRRVKKRDLREGDLVFFHTLGKGHNVTHVGVYLYNDRFIHASISGVQISNLGEGYYSSHFVGAGRVISGTESN